MVLSLRDLLALTSAGILLALSFVTVYYCRRTRGTFASDAAFLFGTLGRRQSLASNTGAVFSVTYFFGATFIYSAVFHGWVRLAVAAGFVLIVPLGLALTKVLHRAGLLGQPENGNPLLELLRQRLNTRHFKDVTGLYQIIYFGLLVEELAVSRLVLHTLIPQPIVVGMLMITIIFVIYTYLYLGGFRAVLAADTVQMSVLVAFATVLLYVMLRQQSPAAILVGRFGGQSSGNALALACGVVFGTSWFLAAVDFYSRLNFTTARKDVRVYQQFALTSFLAVFGVLFVGMMFGDFLSTRLSVRSPSGYTAEAVAFFLAQPLSISVIFLVAIFAMIFTTIDTLLALNLQVGHYYSGRVVRKESLLSVVLLATIISTRMSFDSVSAIGIFIGSLMLLPSLVILRSAWPRAFRWLPPSPRYLLVAMAIATIVFVAIYNTIELRFDRHFCLTLLVASAAATCALGAWIMSSIQRRRLRGEHNTVEGR